MTKLKLDNQTEPRVQKLKVTSEIKTRILVALLGFVIMIGVACAYALSPAIRVPVDLYVGRLVNHSRLYAPTRNAIDRAVIGTRYSVMHVPQAGIAVIFDVSRNSAAKLSDTTTQFVAPNPFYIQPENDGYKENHDLNDCFLMTVPRRTVAAVIIDMDVSSKKDIETVLSGLSENQIGPDQTTGNYVLLNNDPYLVKYLYENGIVNGALQTMPLPNSVDPRSGEPIIDIPIDKKQIMDITCGKETRRKEEANKQNGEASRDHQLPFGIGGV